jgi:hypothetical protein
MRPYSAAKVRFRIHLLMKRIQCASADLESPESSATWTCAQRAEDSGEDAREEPTDSQGYRQKHGAGVGVAGDAAVSPGSDPSAEELTLILPAELPARAAEGSAAVRRAPAGTITSNVATDLRRGRGSTKAVTSAGVAALGEVLGTSRLTVVLPSASCKH